MPAYNEEDNLEKVLNDWYPIIEKMNEKSRLVIADSGSTDSTHNILEHFQKEHPKLVIVSDSGKFHGEKVLYLYKYAIQHNADFVFQTDSDGQTLASDFAKFWDLRNINDAILGYRKNRGDGKFRSFVEWSCCKCIYFFFKIKVKDSNVPFRLIKCSALMPFINKIPKHHNLPNILVTIYLALNDCKIHYEEISFLARKGGKSMYNIKKILNFGTSIIKDFHSIKKQIN